MKITESSSLVGRGYISENCNFLDLQKCFLFNCEYIFKSSSYNNMKSYNLQQECKITTKNIYVKNNGNLRQGVHEHKTDRKSNLQAMKPPPPKKNLYFNKKVKILTVNLKIWVGPRGKKQKSRKEASGQRCGCIPPGLVNS